jgi:Fe-S cluster assembly protein SufD
MNAAISEALPFAATPAMLGAALDELDDLGASGGGAVPAGVRRDALRRYAELARKREKMPPRWRHDYGALDFTDLVWSSGRARVPALPAAPARPRAEDAGDAPALAVENAGGVVHLGSTYLDPVERHGDPRVTLLSLADAARSGAFGANASRTIAPGLELDRFAALATAFQNCGAFVDVPAGTYVEAPLQLIWSSRPGEASAVFPHIVVRIGAGARATILERHVGSTESFVCGIVDVELSAGAQLDYVVVQQADEGARVVMRRRARCAEDARIGWHVADLGGSLVRSTIETRLEREGAGADINALFFARGFGNVDLATDLDHLAHATHSQTIVRTVATGRGQGRFHGAIRIRAGTQRCDASMRDDALVLSRDAYLEAVPALDIASNDARAYHAATIGALDEEELFYVQTRGIPRGRAERMIALAFFEPAIARFPSDALRDEIRTALDTELDEVPETFAQ